MLPETPQVAVSSAATRRTSRNSAGPPAAGKAQPRAVPRTRGHSSIKMSHKVIDLASDDDKEKAGPIDLANSSDDDVGMPVTKMPCSHLFHRNCLSPWLEGHTTCPVCRAEVPEEYVEVEALGQTAGAASDDY